jgi:hypothetical protein
MPTPSHPTLYERLGGVYSIATVVASETTVLEVSSGHG